MPWLSSELPPYTGEYNVGTIDVEVPVEPRITGQAIFKDSRQPAFKLETILFTLYYPAAVHARSIQPKHLWVPKPISLHAEGYARFARMRNPFTNYLFTFGLWMMAGSTEIPANVDVPIRVPPSKVYNDAESESLTRSDRLPVIVFSHGMASSRTSYTEYCGELASRGYVVAAIEHRDGSAPGSTVTAVDETERNVFLITPDQLERQPPIDTAALKEEQLSFRQAEVEETIRVLRMINKGEGDKIQIQNKRGEGRYLSMWRDCLDTEQVIIAGHSYGATLALQTLKEAPSDHLPIRGGIILDPGKHSGPLNDDIKVPIVIIHSNSWSSKHSIFLGRPHFDVVRELVERVNERGHKAWFMTSLGTTHPSVTDAPLIEPMLLNWTTGSTIDVKDGVRQYVRVSEEFLHFLKCGKVNGVLSEAPMSETYNPHSWENTPGRTVPDEIVKFWQIHVAPSQFASV